MTVATFTHANGVEPASAFQATIDWGDGKTSTGSITLSGTTYSVVGSHSYKKAGSHTITTTVTEVGSATELLLAKMGDEVPGLPDHVGDDGDGDSEGDGSVQSGRRSSVLTSSDGFEELIADLAFATMNESKVHSVGIKRTSGDTAPKVLVSVQ